MCKCLKCKNSITGTFGKEILVNSVYTHIKSGSHHDNTPEGERKELAKLIKDFDEFKGRKKKEKSTKDEDYSENYLKFISFLMSKNLSFSQMEDIGDYRKRGTKENSFKFSRKI